MSRAGIRVSSGKLTCGFNWLSVGRTGRKTQVHIQQHENRDLEQASVESQSFSVWTFQIQRWDNARKSDEEKRTKCAKSVSVLSEKTTRENVEKVYRMRLVSELFISSLGELGRSKLIMDLRREKRVDFSGNGGEASGYRQRTKRGEWSKIGIVGNSEYCGCETPEGLETLHPIPRIYWSGWSICPKFTASLWPSFGTSSSTRKLFYFAARSRFSAGKSRWGSLVFAIPCIFSVFLSSVLFLTV